MIPEDPSKVKHQILTCFMVASVCMLKAPVFAQLGHADITLSWNEVVSGTAIPVPSPNGILEPGEAVRFSISISFTPVGTLLPYFPPPGFMAPVAGFQRTGFGISPTTFSGGSWDAFGVTPGFSGSLGSSLPDGSLAFCSVWQPNPPVGSSPIATNPLINVWGANWTPSGYSPGQVAFSPSVVSGDYPHLFLNIGSDPGGNPQFGTVVVSSTFGPTVQVPIAPSPGSCFVVLSVLPWWARRAQRTA